MRSYYSTLSVQDLKLLAHIYREDFKLFGYSENEIYKYLMPKKTSTSSRPSIYWTLNINFKYI